MRGCLVALLFLAFAGRSWAEDKEVQVHTSHFAADFEKEVAQDENGQAALKAWIESAQCEYAKPEDSQLPHEANPEVFKMQAPNCGDDSAKPEFIPYCAARVKCETRTVRFIVRDVYCKAVSSKTCPSAKDCALATHLTRSIKPWWRQSDNKKQTGVMTQDMRGWEPGHTNRYSWTEMDEQELKASIQDKNIEPEPNNEGGNP